MGDLGVSNQDDTEGPRVGHGDLVSWLKKKLKLYV
jgi:hypothetical protein